jgi:hypothetical protein
MPGLGMRALLIFVVVAALGLGYGYYQAATHGWLYIDLLDASVKPYAANIRNAELRLLDGNGKLLANAKSDGKFGVVRLIHPEVGDCAAVEQNASISSEAQKRWQNCFQTVSTWLVGWVDEVRLADVKFAECELKGLPAPLHKSNSDWWLWWVPLPHIGGKPLTYYSMSIYVDGMNCAAVAP